MSLNEILDPNILSKIQDIKDESIKIDVGLSCNAPYSNFWLTKRPENLICFGFEPNPESINTLTTNKGFEHFSVKRFDQGKLNKNFFLVPLALDNVDEIKEKTFYKVNGDPGTSSFYEPVNKSIKTEKIIVKCISLSMFLSLFDFEKIKYIEHIKIDAQGNDLRILKSINQYLDKVVYITIESSIIEKNYYNCNEVDSGHTREELDLYMTKHNFSQVKTALYDPHSYGYMYTDYHGVNPTYINNKYMHLHGKLDCSLVYE